MNAIHTLVIAYGNPLRGDDAVGSIAADIVKSWQLPGVKVLAVHQLVPELIEEMKHAQQVVFIDAGTNTDSAFQSGIVEPKKTRRFLGHYETPAHLLALLRELEGREPEARLVSISALSFDPGQELTDGAQKHLRAALAWMRAFLLVAEPFCTKSV